VKEITILYKDGREEKHSLGYLCIESRSLEIRTKNKKIGSLKEMFLTDKETKKIKEIKIN
jgi:hypothetical protein